MFLKNHLLGANKSEKIIGSKALLRKKRPWEPSIWECIRSQVTLLLRHKLPLKTLTQMKLSCKMQGFGHPNTFFWWHQSRSPTNNEEFQHFPPQDAGRGTHGNRSARFVQRRSLPNLLGSWLFSKKIQQLYDFAGWPPKRKHRNPYIHGRFLQTDKSRQANKSFGKKLFS